MKGITFIILKTMKQQKTMKRINIFMSFMLLLCSVSACGEETKIQEQQETPIEEPGDNTDKIQTAVTLTIGDKVLDAYLNETEAAKDLLSRLPVNVRLSNSGHDYCGDINPPLSYKTEEIQNGWKNGDLAFWTAGNDFVIFHDDEEISSSTGNLVILGHVTSNIEEIKNLNETIDVVINVKSNDNNQEEDMNKSEFKIKVKAGNQELSATLLNNATTRAFMEKLPVTLPMLDLYGREMCYRFPEALPTDDVNTVGYEVGEIVYYPPMHSFVILYSQNGEHFSMQKLGKIDANISVFNNIGDIDVSFERIQQ